MTHSNHEISGAEQARERWERICARFEALLGEALTLSEVPAALPDEAEIETLKRRKEWASQFASLSMAAQRTLAMRITLIESQSEEDDDGEGTDPAEQSHWRAIEEETADTEAE